MTCGYCFAGKGEYHGEKAHHELRSGQESPGLAGGKLRHPDAISKSTFFGGEPLLNFDVVKQLVAYGRSQRKRMPARISDSLSPPTVCFSTTRSSNSLTVR